MRRYEDRNANSGQALPMGGNLISSRRPSDAPVAFSDNQDHKFSEGPKTFRPLVNPHIRRPVSAHQVLKRGVKPSGQAPLNSARTLNPKIYSL